jgi:hypothetical protein
MKIPKLIAFAIASILAAPVFAAESSKDDVINAAKKLDQAANYSWKTTVVVPEDARFKPGPSEGKTEKEGLTHITMSFMNNTMEAVIKGEKGAATTQDGAWKSGEELQNEEGPGRWLGMMLRSMKPPAKQALDLAGFAKELKQEGDAYSGALTEEGATTLQRFGRRGGEGGPAVANPSGSVKFWVKDGLLTKYEFHVKGTMKFNENEIQNDRKTTVEIKDVGTTKVNIPEEAKKKLS